MRTLLIAAMLSMLACDTRSCRCHTGHEEVVYHPAYTSEGMCLVSDDDGDCIIHDTEYHPESCAIEFRCDLSCGQVDTGQAEQHPRHNVYQTERVNASVGRCSDNGVLAYWVGGR